jgi:thymidylate synthase (FAD)
MVNVKFRSDVTVDLMDSMGDDRSLAAAAWISTQGVDANHIMEKSDEEVAGLLNFLMRDRHGTPFEHASMTFRIECPIFVVREFHRHRVGWSYNEESGRYTELKPVFYLPSDTRPLQQVGKPGAYTFEPGTDTQVFVKNGAITKASKEAYAQYLGMLREGIAREVARMVLPVNIFTSFYATCNPRSLMHFLSLRTKNENARFPSFPQQEIEMVAVQMERHFTDLFPETHKAYQAHGRVAP